MCTSLSHPLFLRILPIRANTMHIPNYYILICNGASIWLNRLVILRQLLKITFVVFRTCLKSEQGQINIESSNNMNGKTKALLKEYAARYETTAFLKEDPARFMHLVQGTNNQETMAFIAANLSYGNRKQFFPK